MNRLLPALAVGCMLMLAGCASLGQIESAYSTVKDATVPPRLVVAGGNAFDAAELTAKNILAICTPLVRPGACNDAVLRKMNAGIHAGRGPRDALEAFQAAHPGQLGSKGLYDALTAATTTITDAINAYNGAS
jgi:hypothetical protein